MKKRLILHIGQPKSATTSIQSFLKGNRNALLKQNVLYPQSGLQYRGHHCLGNFFSTEPVDWIKPQDPIVVKTALMAEIGAAECHTVIMSTESLFYPAVDPMLARRYFEEFDIRIFITLRRQDEWLESALRDNMKTGHVDGTDPISGVEALLPSLDYESRIDKWGAVFGDGNMILSTFEPGENREPVEQRFLASVGAAFDSDLRIEPTKNDRLSRDCLEFLNHMGARHRIGAKYFTFFEILEEYSRKHKDPEEYRFVLPPELRQRVMADNAETNARIARKYFHRDDGVLFRNSPVAENVPWAAYVGLKPSRAVQIGEFLADRLYGQLEKSLKMAGGRETL